MRQPRNRYFLLSDIALLPLTIYFSYVLRLSSTSLGEFQTSYLVLTGFAAIVTPFIFYSVGIYARYWRYASVEELQLLSGAVVVSVAVSSLATLGVLRILPGHPRLPLSIPFIFVLLALPVTALPRLAIRLLASYVRHETSNPRATVAVMGAGDAGAMLVRELRNNPHARLEVVGLLDDDPRKLGVRIHGIPVLGNRNDIGRVVQAYAVEQVIIAMPTAPGKAVREIVTLCEDAGVHPKIVPAIHELLNGTVSVNQVRDVEIEDLLRREPVQTDIAAVDQLLRGKRVLVTGGGGSIGSELCRQVLRCGPRELVIVGHGETSIFEMYNELLRLQHQLEQSTTEQQPYDAEPRYVRHSTKVFPVIADIRFAERIRSIFESYRPQIVFHAAAHKHVPLMEMNPTEAITNNVLGTKNVLDAAVATTVERLVMISTDKAVNPTSIMGASKRVAELLVHQAARRTGKAYVAVRFGNVLGSRGSVVPTFKQQIAAGGPVTVTHPEMMRYFMTIPEAVQLVLQASVLGQGGEVFVLDMGEPVRVVDLARDLIELSGLSLGRDIDLIFTGLRPGEKLYEELFIAGESYRRTMHEKILIADNASRTMPLRLDETIEKLGNAARCNDRQAILIALENLVPEFQPPENGRIVIQEQKSSP